MAYGEKNLAGPRRVPPVHSNETQRPICAI